MEIHFLRPYWFIAFIPFIIVCWQLNKSYLTDNWQKVCDPHLLRHLLVLPAGKAKWHLLALLAGGLLAIFALAGPSWGKQSQPIYRALLGRVIVLDLAPSMNESSGSTTKIARARFKLLDFLNRQKEGYTGLIVYSDEAHIVSPLTDDNHTIANFIPALDPDIMPTTEDDTAQGLQEAQKLLKQSDLHEGAIILITDKVTNFDQAKKEAHSLINEGYHLYILNLSDQPNTVRQMETLAKIGGGSVISVMPTNKDIDALISKMKQNAWVPPTQKTDEKGIFWHDDGRWFVFIILPLALLAFRKGYL